MERILKVQIVKSLQGQDSVQCHQKGGKGEKQTTEAESVLASEQQVDSRLGMDAVGVLLTSRKVQGRMIWVDLAR